MKINRKLFLLIIYIIAILVCILLIYVVPSFMGLFDTTYIAEHGTIEVKDNVDAYIIRDDKVYTAGTAGSINRLTEEGQLVKGNSSIVELSGDGNETVADKYVALLAAMGDLKTPTENGTADKAGYVGYYVDGKEHVFSPENLSKLSKKKADSYEHYSMIESPKKRCAKGEPLFKITTNGSWYLLYWIPKADGRRYEEGNTVSITVDENELTGEITKVSIGNALARVEIRCNMFYKEFLKQRKYNVTVMTSKATGAILESDSIIKADDRTGVLVKDKLGKNYFMPVKIKADNGRQAAVYEDYYMDENREFVETIRTYDEIVKKPAEEEIKEALKNAS